MLTSELISTLTTQLRTHSLYKAVQTPAALQIFAEHHVFAVWDFMSLLKSLQRSLTCVAVPWTPPTSGRTARLINEIVLGEESDLLPGGGYGSHFELYLGAMQEIGANTEPIETFLRLLSEGVPLSGALAQSAAPRPAITFVESTFAIIAEGRTHEIAAAFALGREDLVPQMFTSVATASAFLRHTHPQFFYYLDRHIELDGDSHGPLAQEMLDALCAGIPERQAEAEAAVVRALTARLALWDDTMRAIGTASSATATSVTQPAQPQKTPK
jgi:hypothetical protein